MGALKLWTYNRRLEDGAIGWYGYVTDSTERLIRAEPAAVGLSPAKWLKTQVEAEAAAARCAVRLCIEMLADLTSSPPTVEEAIVP